MTISKKALEVLTELLNTNEGVDPFEFINENYGFGICLECGSTDHECVEPDAEGYHCESCGHDKVMGIELAIICYS